MSASLVGSEMCIRDRAEMGVSIPAPVFGVPSIRYMTIRNSETSDRLYPVSYTHLTLPTICSV
eukprot:9469844-Alexandrium_andersonii.AAC.1